jgi:hypothetical protein
MQLQLNFSPKELWKPLFSYENYYEISTFGNIRSLDRIVKNRGFMPTGYLQPGRVLKNFSNGHGYRYVSLCVSGIRKNHYVHRLVAETFLLRPSDKIVVNHKDGNKGNNHLANLEWCSILENAQHAAFTGLTPRGKEKHNAIPVINIKTFKVFDTIKQACNYYHLRYSIMKHNLRGFAEKRDMQADYDLRYLTHWIEKSPEQAKALGFSENRLDKYESE